MAAAIRFDWDQANADHLARHRIGREEAEQVFRNGAVEIDYEAIADEERYAAVGRSNRGRFLTLVFAERAGAIRVITGWEATADEEDEYWKGV